MPDYIGNIAVPEIVPSGTFPLVPDNPLEVRRDYAVAVHQFGSGNAKIEQRFLLGTGARRFTIRKQWLRDADRIALRNFWESKYGPYGAFYYNAPNDDGQGTAQYVCRFANEPLSWEMVADWACSLGVTLIEIPQTSPSYTLSQTVNRFPSAALQTALLSQVQEIIPLVRIQPLEPGYPAIHVSDRRCTIGGQLYQARLVEFDGISQSIGNESDQARFVFGNADRVMRDLANHVDLFRAEISLSQKEPAEICAASPLRIHGLGSNLADSTLLELTANGELILAGGSGNGYRFAELAPPTNPSGWSGVL